MNNRSSTELYFPSQHSLHVLSSAIAKMKTELCNFSGLKIHPGHGRRYARIDGKVFNFINGKCKASFMMKRNPRRVNWTVLYRRKNKKGSQEEITKKRTRRTTKYQRAIGGSSLADIMAKRNQKPEARKAQREQAIKAAKEKTKAKKAQKKAAAPPKQTRAGTKGKAAQKVKSSAPRVGGKR